MADSTNYTPRLQQKYKDVIQQELLASLNLNNVFEVPKICKVVINIGAGSESVSDSENVNDAASAIEWRAGQKQIKQKAKKAIAGWT